MPRAGKILLALVLAGLLAAGALAWLWFAPDRGFNPPRIVRVRAGMRTSQIASQLRRAGVIRSSTAFLLWDLFHRGATLKAGSYRFRSAISLAGVFHQIAAGKVFYYSFTVPEGYNRFEIAQALENDGLIPQGRFLRATTGGGAGGAGLRPTRVAEANAP